MRVTVCQLHDEPNAFDRDWSALCAHARREHSELVLLPELPFGRWFALTRPFDEQRWRESVDAHRRWTTRIAELEAHRRSSPHDPRNNATVV